MKNINILSTIYSENKYKIIFNTSIDLNKLDHNIIKITNIKSIEFLKKYYGTRLNNNLTMFYTNDLNNFIKFIQTNKNLNINLIIFNNDIYTLNMNLIKVNPTYDLVNLLNYNLIKNLIFLNQLKTLK